MENEARYQIKDNLLDERRLRGSSLRGYPGSPGSQVTEKRALSSFDRIISHEMSPYIINSMVRKIDTKSDDAITVSLCARTIEADRELEKMLDTSSSKLC